MRLLRHESSRVAKPALRCVGNIVCAEDAQHDFTQTLVDMGVVPQLRRLMELSARDILKEACWTMSNVAAGSAAQIQVSRPRPISRALTASAAAPNHFSHHSTAPATAPRRCPSSRPRAQAVLDSGCTPRATHLCLDSSTDASVRNEACWIVLNSVSCGTESQVEQVRARTRASLQARACGSGSKAWMT